MSGEVAVVQTSAELLERVVVGGDLAKLNARERLDYYRAVCQSAGLNPLTRPFEYIVLNERLTLYARKDATDQLREVHHVNVEIVSRELVDGIYVVTARATRGSEAGDRRDESIGAVPLVKEDGDWKTAASGKRYFQGSGVYKPLAPEDRANAIMKAETKAKRRVTLSICGLGLLDETEIESIPGAVVDPDEEERDKLLIQIRECGETLSEDARRQLWAEHVGKAIKPGVASLDALRGLLDEVRKVTA